MSFFTYWTLSHPYTASPQAIDGCFLDTACTSPVTEATFTDAESCCIANTPLAFSVGGACTVCVGKFLYEKIFFLYNYGLHWLGICKNCKNKELRFKINTSLVLSLTLTFKLHIFLICILCIIISLSVLYILASSNLQV